MATVLGARAERTAPEIPGVRLLDVKTARLQKRLVLVVTILPFLGLIAAIWTLWGNGLSAVDGLLFASMYVGTGLGVTVGFHRLFTHQSFQTKPWVRYALAVAGSMAIQGPVIRWVADHRRHHAFSDQPGDPHSPHLEEGPGVRGVLKGLWHAHMGWFFSDEQTSARRWAPDMVKDPGMRLIDRLFPLWVAISFAMPAVLGLILTGSLAGATSAFIWGSLVRIFLLHHVTWSINSICHFYGTRPYQTTDFSTNNWMLSLISFGESWHNNHHAFPSSAIHGLRAYQIDLTAGVIRALKAFGLAWDLKTVSPKQLAAKAAA
ncbi:MAG TPA: acyl-CoA desaturase [Actinomycetota bacterium]|nr:acyl-CoA desaturase [Actinomycetota bacterium]